MESVGIGSGEMTPTSRVSCVARRGDHPDPLPGVQRAVDHPHVGHDPAVGVVDGVEDHGPCRSIGVTGGWRDLGHNLVEQFLDAGARLRAHLEHVVGGAPDDVREFLRVLLGLRGRQVDLVEHRDDRQVVLERQPEVRQRLGLDALGGIDQQHGPLTRGQTARDLVGEVDVSGSVDEVEDVGLGVDRREREPDCLRLDGDPALTLDVHPVEVLRTHVAALDDTGDLQHAVGQCRLAVVDVRDDAEVAQQMRGRVARGRGRPRGCRHGSYSSTPVPPRRLRSVDCTVC